MKIFTHSGLRELRSGFGRLKLNVQCIKTDEIPIKTFCRPFFVLALLCLSAAALCSLSVCVVWTQSHHFNPLLALERKLSASHTYFYAILKMKFIETITMNRKRIGQGERKERRENCWVNLQCYNVKRHETRSKGINAQRTLIILDNAKDVKRPVKKREKSQRRVNCNFRPLLTFVCHRRDTLLCYFRIRLRWVHHVSVSNICSDSERALSVHNWSMNES